MFSSLPVREVAVESKLARLPTLKSTVTTSGTVSAGRLECMDFARGIAALAVAVQHCGESIFPSFERFSFRWFNLGQCGLIIFFLVSGFVIPLSIERVRSLKTFWIHRFFRLFPLYWFSLLTVAVLYLIGFTGIFEPTFRLHVWRNVAGNITMLQGALGLPQAIGLYYTLTIELFFYIACTLLLVIHRFRDSYLLTWWLLLAVSVVWICGPLVLHRRVEVSGLFYGLTLFAGAAIYRYFKGTVSTRGISVMMGTLLVSVAGGVYLNDAMLKKPGAEFTYTAIFVSWMAGFAFFFLAYALRGVEFPYAGMWLGRISYSVYLMHPIVSFLLRQLRIARVPLFLLTIAATLVVATFTYSCIEKPMIEFGRRFVKERRLFVV